MSYANVRTAESKSEGQGLAAVLFLLALPFLTWFRAFVLCKLWVWFVVPFGVVPIGKAWGYGLYSLAILMTYSGSASELAAIKKEMGIKPNLAGAMASSVFLSLIFWLSGAIAHWLMQ